MAIADRQEEFDKIKELTNPAVKKALLEDFASSCDSAAVHLKAAALPRQKFQVILPLTTIKDNEIYAPNYKDGEQVALVRYPHGGTFEIPILTVNNRQKEGTKYISKNAKDAVGINLKVAERLSGADFDGDTVMVIPINRKTKITSTRVDDYDPKTNTGLRGFDPKLMYPKREGMQVMNNTQNEMGKITNLIMDMTLLGADNEEIYKAVRHSMVVIDAEKHKLDYKRSEIDNDIAALRRRWQVKVDKNGKESYGGASTLVTKAKSRQDVPKREGSPWVNMKGDSRYDPTVPEGALMYKTAREEKLYKTNYKTGKKELVTQESTKMAETHDAYTLLSQERNPVELAYGDYANKMKAMANEARKTMMTTPNIKVSPSAKETYKNEINSLNSKLAIARSNAPKEREVQRYAASKVNARRASYVEQGLSKKEISEELKKDRQRYVSEARARLGAERNTIPITDKEWDAIQSGAISESRLEEILKYTDSDKIRELATPRQSKELSPGAIAKIKALANSGYTNAEIAEAMNVSTSTVRNYL